MRRLIVKRFESSFGAFKNTIETFIQINERVLSFIEKTGEEDVYKGDYILDRDLLEDILELEIDEIEERLKEYEKQQKKYEKQIEKGGYPKRHKRYKIEQFKQKKEFVEDINSDITLFKEILNELTELKLVENDPKAQKLYEHIKETMSTTPLKGEPQRKIVNFSEYADTIKHLENKFNEFDKDLANRTLVVRGTLSSILSQKSSVILTPSKITGKQV
jgi:DNA repair ATPase RecN